jgi:protein O-mannosyl-transferase
MDAHLDPPRALCAGRVAFVALDYVVWGVRPFGFRLTDLLLHAINAGLVALLARRLLFKALPRPVSVLMVGAATAALLFALHPLRVEPVAWITERRGLLSAWFFLLSVLVYLDAVEARGRGRPGPQALVRR